MENIVDKVPDRIGTTQAAKKVIAKIDEVDYLKLGKSSASRSELFLFAMALGMDTYPTKLDNVDGLILEKSFGGQMQALLYALFIEKKTNDNTLDLITDKEQVYSLAQEYANTGFEILEDYMKKSKDTDLLWTLIAEMDKEYGDIQNI